MHEDQIPLTVKEEFEQTPVDPAVEAFLSGAYRRISRLIILLTVVSIPLLGWRFGVKFALGFLVGCAAAYLNFAWLKRAVDGIVDKIASGKNAPSGAGLMIKFLGRYIVVALLAYVIFRGSSQALYGFCAGLFVPIAAAMCEGIYEAMTAIRNRF
jgi:ATP synthase I subunit